jgi:hypothetical protein
MVSDETCGRYADIRSDQQSSYSGQPSLRKRRTPWLRLVRRLVSCVILAGFVALITTLVLWRHYCADDQLVLNASLQSGQVYQVVPTDLLSREKLQNGTRADLICFNFQRLDGKGEPVSVTVPRDWFRQDNEFKPYEGKVFRLSPLQYVVVGNIPRGFIDLHQSR